MSYNQTGKQNLLVFSILMAFSAGAVVYTLYAALHTSIFDSHDWILVVLTILFLLPGIFYLYLGALYSSKLENMVFNKLGFRQISGADADLVFDNFPVKKLGRFSVKEVFSGIYQNQALNFVKFGITIGSGKNQHTYEFLGLTFTTQKSNYPIQLLDKYNPLRSFFKTPVKLDSNEFNQMFSVYTPDNQDAYYQLDPDTMADLLDIRSRLKHSLNLETLDNRVLIYTSASSYSLQGKIKTTFVEICNCDVSDANVAISEISVAEFISEMQSIFQTLDLTAK